MTTVCVLCDPPRAGLVLPRLVETSPLSGAEAAGLYGAMLKDVCRAVEGSGGELLVNYRPDEALSVDAPVGAEEQLRSIVSETLSDPDEARYEVQVGESFSGRAGNSITFLLEQEDVQTAAVVEPTAAFLTRSQIDEAAMKLRRSDVVLGPATNGRVYYAGFGSTIDFQDAYIAPVVQTMTNRGTDAGHDVDFLTQQTVVETGADLAAALVDIRARQTAGRTVPRETSAFLDGLGLAVTVEGNELSLVR